MEKDDEAARQARAASLLQEIDRLTSTPPATEETAEEREHDGDSKADESPREFIHRRMNELEHEDKP